MAPCTYVRLALGAAPSGRIRFGSLEFIDVNGPTPAFSLLPDQAFRFGDLNFIADHIGRLHLRNGDAAPSYTPMLILRPAYISPTTIDSDALPCRIDAYLGTDPEPKQSQHMFYVLANAFAQLSGGRLM